MTVDRSARSRYHPGMRIRGVVSALAIGALAACGDNSGPTPSAPAPENATAEASAVPAKPNQNPVDAFPNIDPKVGDSAPSFELKTLDGTAVSLAEATARGHVVLVFGSFS